MSASDRRFLPPGPGLRRPDHRVPAGVLVERAGPHAAKRARIR